MLGIDRLERNFDIHGGGFVWAQTSLSDPHRGRVKNADLGAIGKLGYFDNWHDPHGVFVLGPEKLDMDTLGTAQE